MKAKTFKMNQVHVPITHNEYKHFMSFTQTKIIIITITKIGKGDLERKEGRWVEREGD